MTDFELVPVKDEETLATCLSIRRNVFIEEKKVPEEIEVDHDDVLGGDCDHFLMLSRGLPAGTFRCRGKGNRVKIQRFCVLRQFRRAGIGGQALRSFDRIALEKGAKEIEVEAKYEVSRFYLSCGFEPVSEVFEEVGVPHVKMIKKL